MGSADLTRAQYSGYDFNTFSDDLRARAQVKFAADYNDFVASSMAIMLLDLVAFGLDTLSFYLDRRATDTYLSTAITRKAVARISRQLGYKMRAAVSSSVDLDVTIASPGFNVTVPKGFQFYGPNQLIFEAAQDVTWLSSDVTRTKVVPVYEGQTITENFVSDGTASQVFQLKKVPSGKFVTAGTVTVTVNGAPYVENEFLTFEDTNQFEVGYNDDPPTIRFGDGKGAGNIPTNSASIVVTYVASSGIAGLVNAATITSTVNDLVVSFQVIPMTINNPLGSIGGDDPETLDHAKIYAPLVYNTRMVAVTRSDYEALSNSFSNPLYGAVAVAQAISSRSADSDVQLTNLLDQIMAAVSLPVHTAGTQILLGTVNVATTGIVTGTNTYFTDQLSDGDWVLFGSDTTYYQVVSSSIISDTQFTVVPAPTTTFTAVTVTLVGSSIKSAEDRLDLIDGYLTSIGSDLSAVAAKTASSDSNLNAIKSSVRADKTRVVEIGNNANLINTDMTDALTASFTGINHYITTPFKISGAANGDVVYFALADNVTVAHLNTGSLSVSVSGTDVTVNINLGTTTALQVVAAVQASTAASALVQAGYQGTGTGTAGAAVLAYVNNFVTPTTKSVLQAKLSDAQSNATSISSTSTTVGVNFDTDISNIDATITLQSEIGLDLSPADTLLYSLVQTSGDLATQAGSLTGPTGLRLDIDTIKNSVGSQYDDVHSYTGWPRDTSLVGATIYDHVDAILSADCKANLVTVPILARDRAGFFTAPSIGLITSLQTYLDSKKEVTQTVAVVSGESALVPVKIKIRIGLTPGYSEAVAITSVTAVIESLLRNRKFGVSLYLSDITSSVLTVAGVVYADPRITQPASVDEYGDLIIESGQVITKDSASDAITVIIIAASSV